MSPQEFYSGVELKLQAKKGGRKAKLAWATECFAEVIGLMNGVENVQLLETLKIEASAALHSL